MTPITFFAPGTPKGQPRPRAFARKMGDRFVARVYDAGTSEGWKSELAIAARPHLPQLPIAEPVSVTCIFVIARPKSHYRTGKQSMQLRPDAPAYSTSKPDNDNYEKAVWDTLVTVGMLRDDSFIVHNETAKLYTFGARTGCRIEIKPADPLFAVSCADVIEDTAKP